MKLQGSSNIPLSATQSWSTLGSLLTDNCNAESVIYAQQYGQYVRADAMTSMISNYNVLHELWDWSLDNCTVTEMKARIRGVQVRMQPFEFLFGLVLGCNLLRRTVSLNVCESAKKVALCS